jgi:Zn-finger nucleic acid-binding protein
MSCPRCGGEMRTHKRNGVTIDQCRKCHGIFLDRGEFEQLLGRETSLLGNGESLSGREPEDSGRASRWRSWRR